jgi:hypothetical protein
MGLCGVSVSCSILLHIPTSGVFLNSFSLFSNKMISGAMLGSYEYAFTSFEQLPAESWWRNELVLGVRPMIPASTIFCSAFRAMVEQPIEYAKVMGQTNNTWVLKDVFRGFGWQLMRTTLLLLPIFSAMDVVRRRTV